MSQPKKRKANDSVSSSQQQASCSITRAAQEKGDRYDAAQQEIQQLQKVIEKKISDAEKLKNQLGVCADQVISIRPKWQHAQACLNYIQEHKSCTQVKACEMMKKGELPGTYFGVKVKISQRYLSNIRCKVQNKETICSERGRPILLDDFETNFIGNLIKYQQIRNKSILFIQVAMLIRTLKLIKHGYASVEELDNAVVKNWQGGKRKRSHSAAAEVPRNQDSDDEESDDQLSGNETEDEVDKIDKSEAAKAKSFENLKNILGESLGKHLMLPKSYKWPSKWTVQNLCKRHGWTVCKAQMQSAHRFDGASPDMLDAFFEATLRAYINFGIETRDQRHNCDEKHVCAEFEQSGRCVKVMCIRRPNNVEVAGRGRASGTKSASTRMIAGITMIPFIGANNKTTLMVYIRKRLGKESDSCSKSKEKEILDEVRGSYAAEGIAVECFTTDTGWQNQESFTKCMCMFVRELLKEQGVFISFSNERFPTMKELPRLERNHLLFLDNASCHSTSSDQFRLDCLLRGLVLMPTPPNTTNITQACDQHVNKLFTMWLRQHFLQALEYDIAQHKAPKFNSLLLTVWAAQLNSNAAAFHAPQDLVIDLRSDFRGDQNMQTAITNLNSVLEMAAASDRARGRFTSARVARMTVGPWIAALKYASASFVTVGLAAPPMSGITLRTGPTREAQSELQHQLTRFELYPDRVKRTPIAIGAAEVHENRKSNAAKNQSEICQRAAQLLNLVPILNGDVVVQTADKEHELAKSTAHLLWGGDATQSAFDLASTVLQARDLVVEKHKVQ